MILVGEAVLGGVGDWYVGAVEGEEAILRRASDAVEKRVPLDRLGRQVENSKLVYNPTESRALSEQSEVPVPMILFCPEGHRHVDEGDFATRPHHTHACQTCGIVWRPALVDTVGVRFLPGFKNAKGQL